MIQDPTDVRQVVRTIRQLARSTTEVLLIYFVGHGVLLPNARLSLMLSDTVLEDPDVTGLEYDRIREALIDSPARVKIVILDCCYSGRAIETLSPDDGIADSIQTIGTYTLTASDEAAHVVAASRQKNEPTSFTGQFLDLIREGISGGPEYLTLGFLYPHLRQRLGERNLPTPNQRGTDTASLFPFTRNAAYQTASNVRSWSRLPKAVVPPIGAPQSDSREVHETERTADDHAETKPKARKRSLPVLAQRKLLLGTVAVVAILGTFAGILLSHEPPARGDTTKLLRKLEPQQLQTNLLVSRSLILSGGDGSLLTEKIAFHNESGKAASFPFTEPVPSTIAASLADVTFKPPPTKITASAHVAEWQVQVRAHETVILTYSVKVARMGLSTRRLDQFADDLIQALARAARKPQDAKVSSLTILARTTHISPRESVKLSFTAKQANGLDIPASSLPRIHWSSGRPDVVTVTSSGKITGRKPGKARITLQIGSVRASIEITVTTAAPPGTTQSSTGTGESSPPATSGPSPTPTLTGTPI